MVKPCTQVYLPNSQLGEYQPDNYTHSWMIGMEGEGMSFKRCSHCGRNFYPESDYA